MRTKTETVTVQLWLNQPSKSFLNGLKEKIELMVYYGVWYAAAAAAAAAAAVINFPRQNELAIEANITALLANRNRYNNNHLAWLHFVSFANDHNYNHHCNIYLDSWIWKQLR